MNDPSKESAWPAKLLSVLRMISAALFIQHGAQKLLGFPAAMPSGPVPFFSLLGMAGALELFGGPFLLIGLFTRPVAFLLSGEMAVAYFLMHAAHGFWPIANHGELSVLYCFIFLYLAAAGGGPWSVDQMICRSGRPESRTGRNA